MSKLYITTPIYYVNARPHIGSAYTTIAADVLARYHRRQGTNVYFLTGTAEHGSKMAEAAAAAGKTPQKFVDEQSEQFKQAWQALNISNDDFIRTTEKRHKQAVELFANKLQESGKVYEGTYEGLYCVGHEAFVKAEDLDEQGMCPDHKTAPKKIKEKNYFFKLSEYADVLRDKIENDVLIVEPAAIKKEVLSFIDKGLDDISISRQTVEWAIPLPWDKSQTIYVWLDELFNYCSAIGYGRDNVTFKKHWPADLHLVGKDIIKFHCIIWPALLMAIGEPLPKKVFAHGFFTVDGQKMSKSLGNVVDPVEVAQEYGADVLRYFILRDIPFGSDGDFSHQRLRDRYNADLANGLGNLVSRSLNMMEKFYPDFNEKKVADNELSIEVLQPLALAEKNVESLAFDKALREIWTVIKYADELIEKNKPWELAKAGKDQEVKDVLEKLYLILLKITDSIALFMPDTYDKLKKLLEARPLKKPSEPLFARKTS